MQESATRVSRSRLVVALVATGAAMLVLGLAVSAAFAPEWRVLHSLQALIHVAIVILAWRDSAWGFGAGLALAIVFTVGPPQAVQLMRQVLGG